jgi:hypothetical protein
MPPVTYRYTGPNSAVTLKVGDGAGGLKDQDVMLWKGRTVDMPADHEVTKVLVHQGLLVPTGKAQAPAEKPAKAK